ncbi:MAG: PA2169 family four-helix-bundle protein [Janthinobacterium lividum]
MNLPEPISDAADKAQDLYSETADKAKDLYGTAADKAKSLYGDAADKAKDAADKAKDLYGDAADSIKEASDQAVKSFNKLSTTQKIVGGALLAAGLAYIITPKKKGKAKRAAKALDQLLLYVNDRTEGYKRAAAESKDSALKSYYQKLVSQSQDFARTLNDYLTKKGGEREKGTTLKGKLYRKLMDAQALVTNRDEKAILAANVYGEHWAGKAYKKALRRKALKGSIREAVEKQYAESQKTYTKLKELTAKAA